MNNYLTEDAINILKEEIENRKIIIRKQINEDLKEARAHGDLSENFEYKAAKRERARNESRIRFLERMIKTAIIIKDTTASNEVGLNKYVTVKFLEDNYVQELYIVTTVEADPLEDKISIESPLGKSLFKHKVGDLVEVNSPEGTYMVEILNIKKTRINEFWDWSLFCSKEYRHISSKKYPVLPLTYKITYEEVNNLSIKDILEIAPAEKAIKYLAEKGLNMEK